MPKRKGRDGARPRATATVWRPSVWLLPGCSELIKGKRISSRQRDAFTTTDSNGNVRQFVLRCYCTFPVLITNYDYYPCLAVHLLLPLLRATQSRTSDLPVPLQ